MLATAIASAVKIIGSFLKKWSAPIISFFAGRASKQAEFDHAKHEATKEELDAEREASDILNDPDKRKRMRDRFRRK